MKTVRGEYRWIPALCAAFLAVEYLICRNVFPMGDDFMYGCFGRDGIFGPVFTYYQIGNGRWLINILDSLQLRFGRVPYLVLTPWLLLLLGWLLYRLTCLMTGTKQPVLFGFALALLALIDVQMNRESVYWITGAMNYMVPALFLLGGMIGALKLKEEGLDRKALLGYGCLCVLSCLAMEQFSLMAFGWMLLLWGEDCLRRKSLPRRYVVTLLLSALALASILLAPGNYLRLGSTAQQDIPLIFKINDLICYDYYSMVSTAFLFVLEGLCALRFLRWRKWVAAVMAAANALLLLGFRNAAIHASFKLTCLSLLVAFLTMVPVLITVFRRFGLIYLGAMTVIGLGSQAMLLASELWGLRTSFCWVILLILLDMALVEQLPSLEEQLEGAVLLALAIHPLLGLAAIALWALCLLRKKGAAAAIALLLIASVVVGSLDEIQGYQKNRAVQLAIAEAGRAAAEDAGVTEIVLPPYEDEMFGWSSPGIPGFQEENYRNYYGIPAHVAIRYSGAPEQK